MGFEFLLILAIQTLIHRNQRRRESLSGMNNWSLISTLAWFKKRFLRKVILRRFSCINLQIKAAWHPFIPVPLSKSKFTSCVPNFHHLVSPPPQIHFYSHLLLNYSISNNNKKYLSRLQFISFHSIFWQTCILYRWCTTLQSTPSWYAKFTLCQFSVPSGKQIFKVAFSLEFNTASHVHRSR